MNGNKKKTTGVVNDEVEELLRAAEDAALLKLSVNSHGVHASSSDLHPDLDQRFWALKAGSKSATKSQSSAKRMPPPPTEKVKEDVEEKDDLFARFSALKASLPNSSSSTSSVGVNTSDVSKLVGGGLVGEGNSDDDEEDEVEKVIRWAMDAARLDPSPPSDDDDNTKDDDDDYDDSEKSDEDDDSIGKNKKGHRK